MSDYLDSLYTVCKALSEYTGEDELVPMIKAMQAENATLKQELLTSFNKSVRLSNECAALKEQVVQLKTVPMKYRRMTFNAQLQDENAELVKQLTTLQSKSAALVDALEALQEAGNSEDDNAFYAANSQAAKVLAEFKGEK